MDNKIFVLIIEDDKSICETLSSILTSQQYEVVQVHKGKEGILQIAEQSPDVVLLDLGLPDIDGLDIIRQVREWSNVPIIVISSRFQENAKVAALDLGADDYILKPYGSFELLARIRTAVRHSQRSALLDASKMYFISNDLKIDFEKHQAFLSEKEIRFTPIEFKLLSLLAYNAGKVLTYSSIIKKIWGPFADTDNRILRVNMANIRRKIEQNPADPHYIFTELGIGYRMIEEDEEKL